jgi:hypothetical protein
MRSVAEIDKEMRELEAQRDGLKGKLRKLEEERNLAIVTDEVAAMPEARRKALAIAARSIESTAKVGTPGR